MPSKVAIPLSISTSNSWGFQFLHISVNTGHRLLYQAVSGGVKWHLSVVLMCISKMTSDADSLCASSLAKCLLKSFTCFSWVVGFLIIEFWEFSMCSEHKSSIRYVICKYFLSVCDLCYFLFLKKLGCHCFSVLC